MESKATRRPDGGTHSAMMGAILALAVAAATLSSMTVPVSAQGAGEVADDRWEELPPIVITVDGERPATPDEAAEIDALFDRPRAPQARGAAEAASTVGQFTFDYVTSVPPEVQAVAEAAAQEWNDALQPAGPVVVQFAWSPPSQPGILGSAGPGFLGTLALAGGSARIPGAVLNHQAGVDIAPTLSEIRVTISSSINQNLTWCFSTDGSDCMSSNISLFDTILHELGHGLGFLGSAFESENGLVFAQGGVPYLYDTHVYVGQGSSAPRLLSLQNPLPPLTGNDLFFRSLTDQFYAVHAPNPFRSGSSFSHIDEATFGAALMTPTAFNGEFIGEVDGLTVEVMEAVGWGDALVDGRTRPPVVASERGVRLLDTVCTSTLLSGGAEAGEGVVFTPPAGCPVPSEADAVLLTLWAENPLAEGNLRVGPAGGDLSGVVNFGANGLENTTSLWVPLTASDQLELSVNAGSLPAGSAVADNVRIEIAGWSGMSVEPDALGYHPVNPCAFFDTRAGQGTSSPGPLSDSVVTAKVAGLFPAGQGGDNTDCGVPEGAEAVLVNAVALQPTGEVALAAVGTESTLVFNQPLSAPFNNASAVALPVDGNGNVNVEITAIDAATTHVRLQVLGYFDEIGGLGGLVFEPLSPCVVFDSRPNQGATGAKGGERTGGEITIYDVVGSFPAAQGGGNDDCGVPAEAEAVEINVVGVNSLAEGNLRISAAGETPTGGVLNFGALSPKMNNANAVVVPVSDSGEIAVTMNGGTQGQGSPIAHVRGTLTGYWIPAA